MSAMGQKQTLRPEISMSALPPKADIAERDRHVCFGLKGDIRTVIRLPRRARYQLRCLRRLTHHRAK
jgi:hypothetical protein